MTQIIERKESRVAVADILKTHIADYRDQYPLWPEHRKIGCDLLLTRPINI